MKKRIALALTTIAMSAMLAFSAMADVTVDTASTSVESVSEDIADANDNTDAKAEDSETVNSADAGTSVSKAEDAEASDSSESNDDSDKNGAVTDREVTDAVDTGAEAGSNDTFDSTDKVAEDNDIIDFGLSYKYPEQPTEPEKPEEKPEQPTEPEKPEEKPEQPINPTEPEQPTQPEKPVTPQPQRHRDHDDDDHDRTTKTVVVVEQPVMHTDDEIEPIPVYVGYNTTGQEDPAPVPVVTTSSLPKTGDSTNADLMLVVFAASAASLVTMLVMNAKKGRKDKKSNRVIKRAKHDCIVATWEVSKKEASAVSKYEPTDASLDTAEIPFKTTPAKQFADDPGLLKLHPVFRE